MSLLLMVLYWFAIPGLLIAAALGGWRRVAKPWQKGLVGLLGMVVILGWLWLLAGRTLLMDQEVKRLCAIDGGIKVYETVKQPAEKFNEYGQINFYKPDSAEPLGHDYIFKLDMDYSKTGNPSMRRVHYRVFRRSDNLLLGESISYHRVGGDMPGPWHESSFHCPKDAGDIPLLTQVFVVTK
ncbi:MAG: hypothetical protein WAO76_08705 [Georgfuchsia sp.]